MEDRYVVIGITILMVLIVIVGILAVEPVCDENGCIYPDSAASLKIRFVDGVTEEQIRELDAKYSLGIDFDKLLIINGRIISIEIPISEGEESKYYNLVEDLNKEEIVENSVVEFKVTTAGEESSNELEAEYEALSENYSLKYNTYEEAIESFQRELGKDILPNRIDFYVPGKVPREDGDPYFILREINERALLDDKCSVGYFNLITGESEFWEDACVVTGDQTCIEEGEMCGGIAGKMCCEGLECDYHGNERMPDASGTCINPNNTPGGGKTSNLIYYIIGGALIVIIVVLFFIIKKKR